MKKSIFQSILAALLVITNGSHGYFSTAHASAPAAEVVKAGIKVLSVEAGAATQKGVTLSLGTGAADDAITKLALVAGEGEAVQLSKLSKVVRAAARAGKSAAQIFGNTAMRFPTESFLFLVANGALVAKDLVFNYQNNPMAAEQLLDAQLHPITHISFAAFMLANGYATAPLMTLIKSPRLRMFIPYLGMTVGFTASNITHELGNALDVEKCRQTQGETADCDNAMAQFAKIFTGEKVQEQIPSLLSMLGSTLGSAILEQGIKYAAVTAANVTQSKALLSTVKYFEMVLTHGAPLLVGGLPGLTLRVGVTVARFVGFIELDHIMNEPIKYIYLNSWAEGPALNASAKNINRWMQRHERENQWDAVVLPNPKNLPECSHEVTTRCMRDLPTELELFAGRMSKWRTGNIYPVLEKHNNWLGFLNKINSQYNFSKQFYGDFVSEAFKADHENTNFKRTIDRKLPLYGVTPETVNKRNPFSQYIDNPDVILAEQKKRIDSLLNSIQNELVPAVIQKEVLSRLTSNDENELVKGLKILRLLTWPPQKEYPTNKQTVAWAKYILEHLGNPEPDMIAGSGFLKYLEWQYQSQSPEMNDVALERVKWTSKRMENLIYRMVFGPDIQNGQSSVASSEPGFADSWIPPQIRIPGPADIIRPINTTARKDKIIPAIFNFKVNFTNSNQPDVQTLNERLSVVLADGEQPSIFQVARHMIRPEVLSADSKSFESWWTQYAEPQFKKAWDDYAGKYEAIISEFYESLTDKQYGSNLTRILLSPFKKKNGDAIFNDSGFSNSPLESMNQELQVYLTLAAKLGNHLAANEALIPQIEEVAKNFDEINKVFLGGFKKVSSEKVVSSVSKKEIKHVSDVFTTSVEALEATMMGQSKNDYQKRLVTSLAKSMKHLLNDYTTYIQIINATNFSEKMSSDGLVEKDKCANISGLSATQMGRTNCK